MKMIRPFFILLVALVFVGVPLYSQPTEDPTIPQLGDDLGNIVDPGFAGEEVGGIDLLEAAEEVKTRFFFSLSAVDAEGAFISGLIAGGSRKNTQLDLRYLNIGADDGSSNTDQFRLRVKQKITPKKLESRRLALAAVAQYVDARDASEQSTLLLSGAWEPKENSALSLLLNIGWSEKTPDEGESISDPLVGVGANLNVNELLAVALDYTRESDIVKEDFSLTISHSILNNGKMNFGVSKGGVVFGSYVVTFER